LRSGRQIGELGFGQEQLRFGGVSRPQRATPVGSFQAEDDWNYSSVELLRRLSEGREEREVGGAQVVADSLARGVEERSRRLLDLLRALERILLQDRRPAQRGYPGAMAPRDGLFLDLLDDFSDPLSLLLRR
jgi:hypothetical protein